MSDDIQDVLVELLPALTGTLDALETVGRMLHPPRLPALAAGLGDSDGRLHAAVARFQAAVWPEEMLPFRDQMALACTHTLRAADGFRTSADDANPLFAASRALRQTGRAAEALYPIAALLPPISRYFLEPERRADASLLDRLKTPKPGTGVMHAGNETAVRGGFSVYVPEYLDRTVPAPVVFALHGGSGHGRLFLWNWVREARSRGFIVVAPTASGDTWSLMEPETDAARFPDILAELAQHYAIDPARLLLTGMSDGGTFTLLSGLDAESPFTHLAPVAASFHPMLVVMSEPARMKDLPIYLVHGALDWMFPVSVGRTAHQALTVAGAAVTYREIDDLSHTYPRDETARIADWFLG